MRGAPPLVRIAVYLLMVFVVLTPCLAFTAGDFALQIWNKHPRHAKAQDGESPRTVVKTPPGAVDLASVGPVLAMVAPVALVDDVLSLPPIVRPPFVPPRA